MVDASIAASSQITAINDIKVDNENTSDTSETVNGKSEAVQVAIQSVMGQIEALQKYLVMELSALEAETVIILTTTDIRTSEPKELIDICDYQPGGGSGGSTTSLADIMEKGQDIKSDAEGKIDQATQTYEDAKEIGEEIGDAADAVSDLGIQGIY